MQPHCALTLRPPSVTPSLPAHSTHQEPFQHEIVMGPPGAAVQSDRLPPHHLHQGGHRQADLSLGTCGRATELSPTATRRQSSPGPQSSSLRPRIQAPSPSSLRSRGPDPLLSSLRPSGPGPQPLLPQTQLLSPPISHFCISELQIPSACLSISPFTCRTEDSSPGPHRALGGLQTIFLGSNPVCPCLSH